jgi:TatD DNase family protein
MKDDRKMSLMDVHAHLTSPKLIGDVESIVARARAAGVRTIISNGLNLADNLAVAALAERFEEVYPAFGLYPVDAVMAGMVELGVEYPREGPVIPPGPCVDWIREHTDECVAIGEIGLDRYWVPEPLWEEQERYFRALVTIAMDADKPVIIHTRKAEQRTLEVLVELGAPRVVWHCYGSKVKLGLRIVAHGHYLSVPANAGRSEKWIQLLQKMPRSQVLLETDCPYQSPERGVLNEPSNVTVAVALIAKLWSCDEAEVARQLSENFTTLFGFKP